MKNEDYYSRYARTIVMDIDDTISFSNLVGTVAGYTHAVPNLPVIQTMQKLASEGYEFILHTARGWVSCNEDPIKAEEKYRIQIEEWLEKYKVPYSRIIFGKPYGILYVDDKSMKPEEFINHFNIH